MLHNTLTSELSAENADDLISRMADCTAEEREKILNYMYEILNIPKGGGKQK